MSSQTSSQPLRYALRTRIQCHSTDIRCICCTHNGAFITGSRDNTCKVYATNSSPQFIEIQRLIGAQHYISSVCVTQSDVYVGSNDAIIYVYSLDCLSSQPKYQLIEHSGSVCALSSNLTNGLVASGSWDHTCRVWREQKCVAVLIGHEGSVWATAFIHNFVITGSADKLIKLWRYDTDVKCVLTLNGHNDCIRGLAVISETNFLSCSNDATVRQWNIKGEMIGVYESHQNYIYGITVINTNGVEYEFATCSEDRTVRIWRNGDCIQTITLPTQTLWAVACLTNQDLVIAGSDGKVYIYTRDPQLKASVDEQKLLELELSKSTVHLSDIGDIKVNDLPTVDSLLVAGKRDGQTKLVRHDNQVTVYQWDSSKNEWIKIGDVVGSAGSSGSQKQMFNGKEYDYVFSIDIEDGAPPLKLPYNITEEPWTVAQKFIEEHSLSQLYLDQIANFIIKNSQGMVITQTNSNNDFVDPFTGGSRYMPGTDNYKIDSNDKQTNEYFPQTKHLKFESINIDGIVNKLSEFGEHVPSQMKLTNEDIELLLKLADMSLKVEPKQIALIKMMLSWPKNYIFPALDLIRVSLLLPQVNEALCSSKDSVRLIDTLLVCATDTNSNANQLVALRALCNLFSHSVGEALALTHGLTILKALNKKISENKNIQIALSTVFLNFAVSFYVDDLFNDNGLKFECLTAVISHLNLNIDSEANFRHIVALGTLSFNDNSIKEFLKNPHIISLLESLSAISDPVKLGKCSQQLLAIIK